MTKQNTTNVGIFGLVEKIIRFIPIIYVFFRYLVKYTNYFESDFFYLPKIFKNKKINIIDIGASDGISCKFFLKNLNVNYIFCFEPQKVFHKSLLKIFTKFKRIKFFKYGLGEKNFDDVLYVPYVNFFGKKMFLSTYTFKKRKDLEKQIKLDFLIKPNIDLIKIKIRKFKIITKKIDLIKIDTNGSEIFIVKSLKKLIARDKPVFIIENNNIQEIYKFLKVYNYKKFFVHKNVLKKHSKQTSANIIFKIADKKN